MLAATLPMLIALAGPGDPSPPTVGERVRYARSEHGGTVTATVVETGPGWIVTRTRKGGDPVRVPFDGLTRLEVARGRRSRAAEGAVVGFIPGALFGGWVGLALSCIDAAPSDRALFSPTNDYCSARAGPVLAVAGVVGAGTAIVGAITGAFIKTDRWQRVPTRPVTAGLSIGPVRGGAAVSLRVAWR
jgi:hypothetical protein